MDEVLAPLIRQYQSLVFLNGVAMARLAELGHLTAACENPGTREVG